MKNVEKIVIELLNQHLPEFEGILAFDKLFGIEIIMDSIDAIAILLAIEERFGIFIPQEEAALLTTPRELLAYLKGAL